MFNKKVKATIALSIIFWLSLTWYAMSANSSWTTNKATVTTTSSTKTAFSMKEVKVVDANTIKISFSNDLLDTALDTADFALTSKKDETKIMDFSGYTLSAPNELTAKTKSPLNLGEEYSLTAIFISDKDGNLIENWVDWSITFIATFDKTEAPTTDTSVTKTETATTDNNTPTNGTNEEETLNTDLNAAWEQPKTVETATTSTETWSNTETAVAAATTEALPKTWTTENILVILAFILSLWFFIFRNSISKKV